MTDADLVRMTSRYCRVPVLDYQRDSAGLLVSSGGGLMMAVMDTCPTFRWCVDLDPLAPACRWEDWLLLVRAFVRPLAVVGWFSITHPQRLARVVRRLRPPPALYAAGITGDDPFGAYESRFETLPEFLRWAAQTQSANVDDRVAEHMRVAQAPAIRPLEVATAMARHAVNEAYGTENQPFGQSGEFVLRAPRTHGGCEREAAGRVNGEPAAVACGPGAVLNIFQPAHDERGPGLAHGEDTPVIAHGVIPDGHNA